MQAPKERAHSRYTSDCSAEAGWSRVTVRLQEGVQVALLLPSTKGPAYSSFPRYVLRVLSFGVLTIAKLKISVKFKTKFGVIYVWNS